MGSATTLGATPAVLGGTGPYAYHWSPSTGLDDPAAANPMAMPGVSTTYTLTVTDSCGSVSTGVVTLTAESLPAVNIIPSATRVRLGQSVTLDAGPGFAGYLWSTGATTQAITVSPTTETDYSVTVTDVHGCTNTARETITMSRLCFLPFVLR